MNSVEQMQGELAALARRVSRLEDLQRLSAVGTADEKEAQRIAQTLGFAVEVLIIPKRFAERKRLARSLRAKGWSAARIARVFRCCERTAERMIA